MILYLGNFLTEEITQHRNLKFRNVAGSNRMFRIAKSIQSQNRTVEILSQGMNLSSNIPSSSCDEICVTVKNIPVYFAETLPNCKILRPLKCSKSFIKRIRSLASQHKIESIIIFNTSIELLIVSIYIKLFTRIKLINNIEDVTVATLSDWKKSTEANAFFQLTGSLMAKLNEKLCSGTIVPSKNFLPFLQNKNVCVITGCIDTAPTYASEKKDSNKINILYSGKIEFEHGIKEFIESMLLINDKTKCDLNVTICGGGSKSDWLKKFLSVNQIKFVNYEGFVTDKKFSDILEQTDVCCVLQNPEGRYGKLKTPSKFYEFYARGKYIISTNCGDYEMLPNNSFYLLKSLSTENLKTAIEYTVKQKRHLHKNRQLASDYSVQNFDFAVQGKKIIEFINQPV